MAAILPPISSAPQTPVEYFDVLNEIGAKTGIVKLRSHVHRDGDWHRSVHVWVYAQVADSLLIQKRAACKESWPSLWDVSAAGHVTAGDQSLETAQRETEEELGLKVPHEVLQPLFSTQLASKSDDGSFVNNEFCDVYLITTQQPLPLEAFSLQEEEVEAVRYIQVADLQQCYAKKDPTFVCTDSDAEYFGKLFEMLRNPLEPEGACKVIPGQVGDTTADFVVWSPDQK